MLNDEPTLVGGVFGAPQVAAYVSGVTFNPISEGEQTVAGVNVYRFISLGSSHTGADVAYYFPDQRLLVTGDVFLCGYYPHADRADGGSLHGLLIALDKLALIDEVDTVVGGHGRVCNQSELVIYRDQIAALVEHKPPPAFATHQLSPIRAVRTITSANRLVKCADEERTDQLIDPWLHTLPNPGTSGVTVPNGWIHWLKGSRGLRRRMLT